MDNRDMNSDTQELYLLGGIPIDRVAWRVVGKGEHWNPMVKGAQGITFDAPPPPKMAFKRGYKEKLPEDLRGRRRGRLVAVCYWGLCGNGTPSGATRQRWVCRCDCGLYVIRSAKAIKRNHDDMCEHCQYLKRLRWHSANRAGLKVDGTSAEGERQT